MGRWWSEYHPSEGPGSEGLSEVPEVLDLDAFTAFVVNRGSCDLLDLTGGQVFGHHAFILFD